jgi:hypothetical protein
LKKLTGSVWIRFYKSKTKKKPTQTKKIPYSLGYVLLPFPAQTIVSLVPCQFFLLIEESELMPFSLYFFHNSNRDSDFNIQETRSLHFLHIRKNKKHNKDIARAPPKNYMINHWTRQA